MRIRTEHHFSQAVLLLIVSTVCDVRLEQIRTGRQEGNVFLFNDALNTFYFTVIWRRTYGKGPLR